MSRVPPREVVTTAGTFWPTTGVLDVIAQVGANRPATPDAWRGAWAAARLYDTRSGLGATARENAYISAEYWADYRRWALREYGRTEVLNDVVWGGKLASEMTREDLLIVVRALDREARNEAAESVRLRNLMRGFSADLEEVRSAMSVAAK